MLNSSGVDVVGRLVAFGTEDVVVLISCGADMVGRREVGYGSEDVLVLTSSGIDVVG